MSRFWISGLFLSAVGLSLPAVGHAQKFLKKDVGGWVKELGDPMNESARRSAAYALGKMGKYAENAVPALKRALEDDKSSKVREAVAFALGEIGRESLKTAADPELVPLLVKSLKTNAWPVRRSAAYSLGCLGTDASAAQEPLETALTDPAPEVRQNAAWALGRIGPAAIAKLRLALADGDPFVKRDAAQSLNLFDPVPLRVALTDFLTLSQDGHTEARRAAVTVLIRIVGPEDVKIAAEPLRSLLTDKDEEIRRNAALALANIGGKEAAAGVPVLVDALHRGDIELRRQAAAALRNIGPEAGKAVPDLLKALKDEDLELRTNAAHALGGMGSAAEKAVPALVSMMADAKEKQEPRMAAASAMSRIGPVPAAIDAVPRINQLIANAGDDPTVRWRAVWALRVHDLGLRKLEGVYPALAKVLKEPKTTENHMLRYDCAYMLGLLQQADVSADVLDVLSEFLKDPSVQIYVNTQATVQGAGAETGTGKAKITEQGKGDGRVMATQALRAIGVAKVRQRPDIVQQLQALAANADTFADLKKDCTELVKALGK